jgi:hypothetical protein
LLENKGLPKDQTKTPVPSGTGASNLNTMLMRKKAGVVPPGIDGHSPFVRLPFG